MKILLAKQKWPILEKELQTDIKRGLTSQQVQYKKNLYGKNKLKNNIQTSIWYKIKHQINNFLVLILMIASIVIFIIGFIENSFQELFEGVLILAIIFINVLLGVFYEYKVEKAVSFINQKTLPYMKVLRDDQIQLIVIEDIVIGDIVFLEIGDVVPADLRIIEANNLQMEESILTGENTLVTKNNLVDDNENNLLHCCNLVFKDTVVFYGKAKGVVIAVGMDTEIGKIMTLVKNIKISATPLEKNMNQLGKFLTVWILFLIMFNTLIVFVKHYYVHQIINFLFFKKIFLISVSLAVAVIPEGILTIITIILILSMKKLLNKKTIVKNIYALETLSTVQVICTDKTGTLTKNQLNIVNICFYQQSYDVQNNIFFNNLLHKILKYGILCSNINVNFQKQTSLYKNNPIDQSFLNLSLLLNYNVFDIINKNAKILEIPFDSDRKLMTTVHQNQENYLIITKGAPEILFSICKYIDDNGNILSKNNCNFNFFENYLEKMSQQSLRVIGIAYKKINSKRIIKDDLRKEKIEKDLIFLGLVSFQDLIKPEAFATIDIFQKAHIKPIMITGDNSNTALAVAKKLNIFNDKTDFVVNGDVVEKMTEKELNSKLDFITVYARITPINKLKIINAWQKKGFTIAMIGDGVNDAPSLKKADIGISMGQKGTEISKVASDIIIMDDNLLTITVAIKEGRNIFYSIQKSLIFLMSCNTGELTAILLNTFFNFIFFDNDFILLTSLQILWINLVTDSFIAISLGINAKEDSVMLKTSRNLNEKIIDQKIFFKIILGGLIIGFVTFLSAIIGFSFSKYKNLEYLQRQKYAQTFAFMVLSLSQLFHVFNLINFKKSVFVIKPSINLITIFILSFLVQFLTIKIDFLKNIFHLVNLNFLDILLILLLSMIPFIILDIIKKFHYIK